MIACDFAAREPMFYRIAGGEGVIHAGSLTFIPETTVLVAVVDDWIKAWDFRIADPRPLLVSQCKGSSSRIELSPSRYDDVALLSANRGGGPALHWWRMATQDPKVTSVRHRATSLPFMLSDDDGTLRLWDVRRPDSVWILRKSGVKSMAFTGGELAVLAQSEEDNLLLWDVARLTSAQNP